MLGLHTFLYLRLGHVGFLESKLFIDAKEFSRFCAEFEELAAEEVDFIFVV
jgi:hypothetical protein